MDLLPTWAIVSIINANQGIRMTANFVFVRQFSNLQEAPMQKR